MKRHLACLKFFSIFLGKKLFSRLKLTQSIPVSPEFSLTYPLKSLHSNVLSKTTIEFRQTAAQIITTGGSTGLPFSFPAPHDYYSKFEHHRKRCWALSGITDSDVILSLTHSHSYNYKLKFTGSGVIDLDISQIDKISQLLIKLLQPTVIVGYPSTVKELILHTKKIGISFDKLRLVMTGSEYLSSQDKKFIEQHLNTPCFQWYAQSEMCVFAAECPTCKVFHVDHTLGYFLINSYEETNRAIASSLYLTDFQKYDIGDTVIGLELSNSKCGFYGQSFKALADRRDDNYLTFKDQKFSLRALNQHSVILSGIFSFQIVVWTDKIVIRYISSPGMAREAEKQLKKLWLEAGLPSTVEFLQVEKMLRTKRDKHNFVVYKHD